MNSKCAWLGLKSTAHYRCDSFARAFAKHGFKTEIGFPRIAREGDVLLIWNRQGAGEFAAQKFEDAGNRVIVAENGYLGKELNGQQLFTLSHNHHNGIGAWPTGDGSRWESFEVPMQGFRKEGSEIVLLPQRSIGEMGVAMPSAWLSFAHVSLNTQYPLRIRHHPGISPCVDLETDLRNAFAVYTWASGAAIKALTYGIPVIYDLHGWIAAGAASRPRMPLNRSEVARREMFERMAWSQWRLSEIEDGSALERYL